MYYNSTFEMYHHKDEVQALRETIKEKDAEIKRLKDKYETTPLTRLKHSYYNIITSSSDLREYDEYMNRYMLLMHIDYIFINFPKLEKEFTDLTGTSQELRQRFDAFVLSKRKEYPNLESHTNIREGSEYLGFE